MSAAKAGHIVYDAPCLLDSQVDLGGAPSFAWSSSVREMALTVVIPTFNEAGNVRELLKRLEICLDGIRWNVIVVDDNSADGTAEIVTDIGMIDSRVRCIRRVGKRGLASACIDGMMAANGRFFAVMDADLQHDESLLPAMLRRMRLGNLDIVVGSRYLAGGGFEGWHAARLGISRVATWLTRVGLNLGLSDPMSGFFMIRPEVLRCLAPRLSEKGFKLLMDLISSAPEPLRIEEIPYHFSKRRHGRSKLDSGVVWAFALLLARQISAKHRRRFGRFCAIGASGVLVHLSVLTGLQSMTRSTFSEAQTVAVIVSMIGNFALNNRLTFPDVRMTGARFFLGLSRFGALCAVGAIVNVMVADALFKWSGLRMPAAIGGIVIGAIFNYLTTSAFVWSASAKRTT